MEETIKTEGLSKQYRDVEAVSDLSISVRKGEIYGFLGLNGAGKTTTIRMLLGMIRPGAGKAYINGKRIHAGNGDLWTNTGHMVEIPYAYPNLTVRENLDIVRRLRSLPVSSIDDVIGLLRLTPYAHRKAKNLSLGNAQRLGLAKALIHHPSILILDEPANGLDPAGIYEIRELLIELARKQGATIFVSSHILGEVSKFASRIGIIHEGKLLQELDAGQLAALCNKRLLVGAANHEKAIGILRSHGLNVTEKAGHVMECSDEEVIR
ncbi:MAG TPA: ABC transporter ATP-binding protein, partial [Bacteroidales bacterium]|nr:ABC transporter ATP-binding protein [Bacteroidales bacterium]